MSETICSQEIAVTRAVRSGEWNDSLEAHVAVCASCREISQAVRAMQSLAAGNEGATPMPEATRLWCLALLEQKQREAARARRSLVAMEIATTALVALGCILWLAWNWPQLQELVQAQLSAWQSSLWPQLWQAVWRLAVEGPTLASRTALLLALLLAAAAIVLVQPLLAED